MRTLQASLTSLSGSRMVVGPRKQLSPTTAAPASSSFLHASPIGTPSASSSFICGATVITAGIPVKLNKKVPRDIRRETEGNLTKWRKSLYQQKIQQPIDNTKTSITQRLRTDLEWSVGVTTAILQHSQQKGNNHCRFGKTYLNDYSIYKSEKGQEQRVGRVSVQCWHATSVANALWKPLVIR